MKYPVFLLLLSLCGSAGAQTRDVTAQAMDIIQLNRLNDAWMAAYPTHDTTTLGRILASDFQLVNPSGTKMTRQEVLDNFATTNQTAYVTTDSVQVRLFGDVAYLVAYIHAKITSGSHEQTVHICYGDVYCKRDGQWQAVASHVAMLP